MKRSIKTIKYTSRFNRSYKKLSSGQKTIAEERELIFRNDAFDSKLRTHKLSGELNNYWSFSVTYSHRILFRFESSDSVLFLDIGDHRVYK